MNKALFCILMASGLTASYAQVTSSNQPPELTPLTPAKPAPPKIDLKAKPRSPREPGGDVVLIPRLNGLIIVGSDSEVKKEGVPDMTGLKVGNVPLVQGKDFPAVVAPYLGQPMSKNKIQDLEDDIVLYCRAKNHPLVDVILLDQTVNNGVIQLWLLEGKIGSVTVRHQGRKWFNDSFILSQVRLQTNQPLDARELQSELDWVNRNPFREVDAQFKQGDKLGQSDVVLQVHDQLPLRVYAGYENTGNKFTGEDRFLAGFNWGNVFGLDQQLNYQYTTDSSFKLVKANSASYIIPLPWRHTLTLFGSYVDARADLGSVGTGFSSKGQSYQASMRYEVPLPGAGKYQHAASVGFDFKRGNNNLEFGGSVVSPSSSAVAQFELGYSAALPDAWGQTSAGIEGYYSPGGLTSENNDAHFTTLRSGAKAQYVYGRLNAQRLTRLPMDFSWILKGTAQVANHRLIPSEQLGEGGYNTVRGYEERIESGDDGWLISNELRTPAFKLGSLLEDPVDLDYLQGLAFFDYGSIHTIDQVVSDTQDRTLSSIGGGIRYTMGRHLSVRFDYGYELSARGLSSELKLGSKSSRVHIGVVASF